MIVLFSKADADPQGKYPFDIIMRSSVALVQEDSGNVTVLKDRYFGAVGNTASLEQLERWAIKDRENT